MPSIKAESSALILNLSLCRAFFRLIILNLEAFL